MYSSEHKMRQTIMSFLKTGCLTVVALVLCACVSAGNSKPAPVSASDTCAPGETLTCEVSNTGRIKHGSFNKGGKNCACERDGQTGPPIIPQVP
jgi:hypothetical protein